MEKHILSNKYYHYKNNPGNYKSILYCEALLSDTYKCTEFKRIPTDWTCIPTWINASVQQMKLITNYCNMAVLQIHYKSTMEKQEVNQI